MVRIVRVSPRQFSDLAFKLTPEHRWTMNGFTSANLYLAGENTLIVRRDEVEIAEFPEDEVLSVASAIHCAYYMKEV